jgi:hypothetical protein
MEPFHQLKKSHHSLSNLTKKQPLKLQCSSRIRKKEQHRYINNNNNRVKKEEQQLKFNNNQQFLTI